jgi:putative transposase
MIDKVTGASWMESYETQPSTRRPPMIEMSVEKVSFLGKVLEEANGDMPRGLLLKMLEQVTESEANAACGPSYGNRDGGRVNQRNGYRDRAFETRLGTLDLSIPKLRQGSHFPSFLTPRRR